MNSHAVLFPFLTLYLFRRSQACSISHGKKSSLTDNFSPHRLSRSIIKVLTISSIDWTAFSACPFPFESLRAAWVITVLAFPRSLATVLKRSVRDDSWSILTLN